MGHEVHSQGKARNHFENQGFYLPRRAVFLVDFAQPERLKSKRSVMSDRSVIGYVQRMNMPSDLLNLGPSGGVSLSKWPSLSNGEETSWRLRESLDDHQTDRITADANDNGEKQFAA